MSLRLLTLLIYVALGVVADIFIALYYMALSERRAFQASLYAVIIPLFTFVVIERALATHDVTAKGLERLRKAIITINAKPDPLS